MADSSRPITPFRLPSNKSTAKSDALDISSEGSSAIENTAIARQAKHQENKDSNKNNQICDFSWLDSNTTSVNEPVYVTSEQVQPRSSIGTPKTTADNHLRQQQQSLLIAKITRDTAQTESVSLPAFLKPESVVYNKTTYDSKNTERPTTATSEIATEKYIILEDKQYTKFFQQDKFCDILQHALEEKFSIQVQIKDTSDDSDGKKIAYTILLKGSLFVALSAYGELDTLLTESLQKKTLDKNTGDFWVCEPEAAHIIQKYVNQKDIICLCEASETIGLTIYYFETTSFEHLSTKEATIDDIIYKKFISSTITVPEDVGVTKINEHLEKLEECCLQISNNDTLIMVRQTNRLLLFGLTHIVKRIINEHEKLLPNLSTAQIELNLQDYQIDFLLNVCQVELKQLEEQNGGLQIINGIKSGYITGPRNVLDTTKEKLNHMLGSVQQKSFNIDDIRFSSMAAAEKKRLVEIGLTHKCLLMIDLKSTEKTYSTPISSLNKDVNGLTSSAMSIDIRIGDLAEQSVDMVVVPSTSQHLLDDIRDKGGARVKNRVNKALSNGNINENGYSTSAGQLLCQRLFFLPWTTKKLKDKALQESIHKFFTTAIKYALENQQTSIAFPALGCGELKYDPKLIAEIILDETQRHANYKLQILIVILPDKIEAYEAFCLKLAKLRQRKSEAANPITFFYPHITIKGTLIGSEKDIQKCLKAVKDHINGCVQTDECDEFPLNTWNQETIDIFFKCCFQQHVIPEVNSTNEKLKLAGPKDKVMEMKVEYYRMKSIKADEARIASYARIAVWVCTTTAGTIEKYSLKLNAIIEEAHSNQFDTVKFKNENGDECVIQFEDKIEICGERQRGVIRKDFHIPQHWIPQSENVIRCLLTVNDSDYSKVLDQFNQTMSGKYTWIQIERTQNQRWYTAYKTFKQYSKQKDTEQLLFHGCLETSADMIIHSCFNRSFAGVNGVAYGVGVYFSKNASYSHGYAHESPTTHKRCMFLAKVLVGKSILGSNQMRVPPDGYDSTTDKKHIFVTYHDDQAYAEYLITYTTSPN